MTIYELPYWIMIMG